MGVVHRWHSPAYIADHLEFATRTIYNMIGDGRIPRSYVRELPPPADTRNGQPRKRIRGQIRIHTAILEPDSPIWHLPMVRLRPNAKRLQRREVVSHD